MSIGDHIRARRKELDLTQEQLARRAEIPLNRVGRIETGMVKDPHFSTLQAIATALDTSVGELIGESAPKVLARL